MFLLWNRISWSTCNDRYSFFNGGFVTCTRLPLYWKSPFGFGIGDSVLTFRRRGMVIPFYINLLLRILSKIYITIENVFSVFIAKLLALNYEFTYIFSKFYNFYWSVQHFKLFKNAVYLYSISLGLVMYTGNFYIISLFLIFSLSCLILIYIWCIDTTFRRRYPVLSFFISVVCIVVSIYSFIILMNYLLGFIKFIFEYVKMTGAGGPNSSKSGENNPSTGSKGPNNPKGGKPANDTILSPEEKKRRDKEKAKEYRLKNRERIKANRKKYNDSEKGKTTKNEYENTNADRVKESKRKYNNSDKGKETIKNWGKNHPDQLWEAKEKYSASEKGKEVRHAYYEDNKEWLQYMQSDYRKTHEEELKRKAAEYYRENAEQIKINVKAYRDKNKDDISLSRALKYAMDKLEGIKEVDQAAKRERNAKRIAGYTERWEAEKRYAEKKDRIDREYLAQVMKDMEKALKTKEYLDANGY